MESDETPILLLAAKEALRNVAVILVLAFYELRRKFAQRQISLASSMENAASSGREITFYANKTETPFSHGNLSRHPPRRIADRAPKKARISLSRVERQPRSICFPTSTLPIVATVQPRRKQENATNPYPYALFVGSQTLIIAFCFRENIIHAPPCSSTMRGHDVAGYCDTTEFQDGRVPETRGCREQKEFNFVLRVFCAKGYTEMDSGMETIITLRNENHCFPRLECSRTCELGIQRAKWAFTRRASEMERGPSEIRAQAEIVCDVVSRPRFTCAHHCAQMLCACIIPRMKSEREQEEATSTWSGRSLPYESRHSLRRHLT
ncbi:hypothetical protein V1477_017680 [Vespula maculifrons]|uniref:Uncharacterized protein n=1 Tax=Vespula maculifrons TaxID=7453 RepID=A0ABD2B6Q2_VESMC